MYSRSVHTPCLAGRLACLQVCHPGVAENIARDFRLLMPLAALTSRVRGLRFINLKQTLAQFSASMTAQVSHRAG